MNMTTYSKRNRLTGISLCIVSSCHSYDHDKKVVVFFRTVITVERRFYILAMGKNADTYTIMLFITLLTVRKKQKQEDKAYFFRQSTKQ